MIKWVLMFIDDCICDKLLVNFVFLFVVLFWYLLCEKIDELKNEGGLNMYDLMMFVVNEILDESCKVVVLYCCYMGIICEIWVL